MHHLSIVTRLILFGCSWLFVSLCREKNSNFRCVVRYKILCRKPPRTLKSPQWFDKESHCMKAMLILSHAKHSCTAVVRRTEGEGEDRPLQSIELTVTDCPVSSRVWTLDRGGPAKEL